jgi:hypothetical protein
MKQYIKAQHNAAPLEACSTPDTTCREQNHPSSCQYTGLGAQRTLFETKHTVLPHVLLHVFIAAAACCLHTLAPTTQITKLRAVPLEAAGEAGWGRAHQLPGLAFALHCKSDEHN